MVLPQATEFLIVGAGPTGLATALTLHKQGCRDMVIVDGMERGENTSRALAVHAATLEMLDQLGCAEPLVEAGAKHKTMKTWNGDQLQTVADFEQLNTKFPFVLIVPQYVTEEALGAKVAELAIPVYRPIKAIGLHPYREDPNYTEVLFEFGETIRARYVVGADGSRSMVRQAAGVGYQNPNGEQQPSSSYGSMQQLVLGDVTFTEPLGPEVDSPTIFISNNNTFINLPFPVPKDQSPRTYRILSGIPSDEEMPPPSPPKSYLQGLLTKYGISSLTRRMGGPSEIEIDKVIWSSRFRAHSSIADTFFTRLDGGKGGVIVLVGDAGHIHPPAGGQGMNLGLRDAIFLGPILAAHAAATTSTSPSDTPVSEVDKPLRAWADQRRKQGLTIIKLTGTILWFVSLPDRLAWIWGVIPLPVKSSTFRNLGLWIVGGSKWLQGFVAWRLSGLGSR